MSAHCSMNFAGCSVAVGVRHTLSMPSRLAKKREVLSRKSSCDMIIYCCSLL